MYARLRLRCMHVCCRAAGVFPMMLHACFVRRYVLCVFRWAMVRFSTCDMSLCIFRCAIEAVPFSTCDMCRGIFNRQYVLCVFRCVIYVRFSMRLSCRSMCMCVYLVCRCVHVRLVGHCACALLSSVHVHVRVSRRWMCTEFLVG